MLGAIIILLLIAAAAYAVTQIGGVITLLFIAAILFLAYKRLSLLAFTATFTVLLVAYTWLGAQGEPAGVWKGFLWVMLAGLWLLNVRPLRKALITRAPAWWDPNAEPAYLNYVSTTIRHIAGESGYGGSILDYGFLDAQWDYNGGASGWAQVDIDEFHNTYLPQTYGTIANFNAKNGTSYGSFGQVPAATPGQALAGVYQQFRVWSVQTVYGQMTANVRAFTNTPLYYYYGGHLGDMDNYANIPDLFFGLAKQYDVTVIVDSAQATGLALTFASLAHAYGVKLAQEWTAPSDSSATRRAGRAVDLQLRHGSAQRRR